MSKNIRTQMNKVVGKSLNAYYQRVKPTIDDIKFKEQYQGRIIDCMVGEVDDNYIETPETDSAIVKLEHSKEGLVKVPSIKGKTILVDADGNETDTPAEGCRLVSVGEDEDNKMIILSKNKNLITKENLVRGRLGDDGISTEIADAPSLISKDFINISGIEYISLRRTLGTHQNSNHAQISFYDKDKNKIGKNYYDGATSKQSVPNGAIFAKFRVNMDNTDIYFGEYINIDQYQYIEPKYHKTEILLDESLRSLPSGVCDELVGNKLIRRLREVALRGDETIGIFKEKDEHISFSFEYKNFPNSVRGSENLVLSNNFKWLEDFSRNEELINFAGAIVIITISKSKLETPDIEGFKKWLKLNPTSIIYPLKEPIIEELPNGIALQGFDDTTMYIENSITPTVQYGYNALIPYKEELRTQKEEVETNTLDIENNIIPYLMDMEFNLMLMEDE